MTKKANKEASVRTTELLSQAAEGAGPSVTLHELLDTFDHRAFGFVLLLANLPNFIPAPVGAGAVTGPLTALIGVQMLFGREYPWLPQWLGKKKIQRKKIGSFAKRMNAVLRWVERISRPRLTQLTTAWGNHFSGLLLVALGVALALPIPFTNYIYGAILVIFAMALIGRDGGLLVVVWIASIASLVALLGLGDWLIDLGKRWFG